MINLFLRIIIGILLLLPQILMAQKAVIMNFQFEKQDLRFLNTIQASSHKASFENSEIILSIEPEIQIIQIFYKPLKTKWQGTVDEFHQQIRLYYEYKLHEFHLDSNEANTESLVSSLVAYKLFLRDSVLELQGTLPRPPLTFEKKKKSILNLYCTVGRDIGLNLNKDTVKFEAMFYSEIHPKTLKSLLELMEILKQYSFASNKEYSYIPICIPLGGPKDFPMSISTQIHEVLVEEETIFEFQRLEVLPNSTLDYNSFQLLTLTDFITTLNQK